VALTNSPWPPGGGADVGGKRGSKALTTERKIYTKGGGGAIGRTSYARNPGKKTALESRPKKVNWTEKGFENRTQIDGSPVGGMGGGRILVQGLGGHYPIYLVTGNIKRSN